MIGPEVNPVLAAIGAHTHAECGRPSVGPLVGFDRTLGPERHGGRRNTGHAPSSGSGRSFSPPWAAGSPGRPPRVPTARGGSLHADTGDSARAGVWGVLPRATARTP